MILSRYADTLGAAPANAVKAPFPLTVTLSPAIVPVKRSEMHFIKAGIAVVHRSQSADAWSAVCQMIAAVATDESPRSKPGELPAPLIVRSDSSGMPSGHPPESSVVLP